MPKNTGGARKNRGKKREPTTPDSFLPFKEDGQYYALVLKMLGNRRLRIKCDTEKESLCVIPRKFKGRRNWISEGMILLVTAMSETNDRHAVIYIYNENQVKRLRKQHELDTLISDDQEYTVYFDESLADDDNDVEDQPFVQDIDLEDI